MPNRNGLITFAAMSNRFSFYYSNTAAREKVTSSVFFNAIFLADSRKVLTHTHTHTHTHNLLASFFIRARVERCTPSIHGDSERFLCVVFRAILGTDIRENKDGFSRQNPHDFREVKRRVSTNINPHSAYRPHVGTDPVSVHLTSVLRTEAIYWSKSPSDCVFIPAWRPTGADRHGVCPYMRPIGRIGTSWFMDIISFFSIITPCHNYK